MRRTLRRLGIADGLYTDILTSGEATWQALNDRDDPWFASLGTRAYHLGPARDRGRAGRRWRGNRCRARTGGFRAQYRSV
ncbi:MAG: hypothetical protein WDN04_16900 [Rhodospirillales bacterium]